MNTTDEILDRAIKLLNEKPTWANDSEEFKKDTASMLAVAVDMASYESHSDRNEFYSDTAQFDSSKYAKASDIGKVPGRPLPQIITCSVKVDGIQEFNENSIFLSDNGLKYLIDGTVVIDNETALVTFRQEEKKEYHYTPTSLDYQNFVVGSKKTRRFLFYVGNHLWDDLESMGELKGDTEGYVTLYNIYDQLYVRTGNNFAGKIPDGPIKVVSYDTESNSIQVGAPLYAVGETQPVEIKVTAILQSPQPQESADSVDQSLPFVRLQGGSNGYELDYVNDIRTGFPGALFVNCWGEKKNSQTYNRDDINVIFISALRKENQGTFGAEIVEYMEGLENVMQINFEWREPILIASSISIVGKTERSKVVSTSEAEINAAISKYYGLYAEKVFRKDNIYKQEIDDIVKATGVFNNQLPGKSRRDQPNFELTITGSKMASNKREIIYIPVENITLDIKHIDNKQ